MLGGNGSFGRNLPARLDAALRAARAGHHVSFDALRVAVCAYIDELIAGGMEEEDIRLHVVAAFQEENADAHASPAGWNDEMIDEMIALCRDR